MAGNNQILARLGVVMTANSAGLKLGLDEGAVAVQKFSRKVQSEFNTAQKEIDRLTYAAQDFGKTLTEVDKINRQLSSGGKLSNLAGTEKAQELLMRASAFDKLAVAQKNQGQAAAKAAGLTAFQLQQLNYQTTDIFTSLAGGQSPLLVLIQQGGQLKDSFGGVGNVFKAFAQVLTPIRLLLGGIVGVVGTMGFAFYKAQEDLKLFNNQMALSGKISGITYDQFQIMSQNIAKESGVAIGSVKDIAMQMVASGQIYGKTMDSVGRAIALNSRLSGQAADEVAKKLIPAFTGGAKAVFELDKQSNFLTLAQYKQIEGLQQLGDKQGIATLASEAYVNHIKDSLPKLSLYEKAVNLISGAWDTLKQKLTPDTQTQMFEKLKTQLALFESVKSGLLPRSALQSEGFIASTENIDKTIQSLTAKIKEFEAKNKIEADANAEDKKQKALKAAFETAGGMAKIDDLKYQTQRAKADLQFQNDVFNVDKLTRIQLEGDKKVKDLIAERAKAVKEAGASQEHIAAINTSFDVKEKAAIQETAQKKREAILEESKSFEDKIRAGQLQIDQEDKKLEIYKKNINASEEDVQKAMARLEFEKQINDVRASRILSDPAKAELIAQIAIQNAQKQYIAGQLKSLLVSRDTARAIEDKQKAEKDALQLEEEKLNLYSQNVLISDKDMNIALSRLKTEQEIAKIRKQESENKLTPDAAKAAIEEEQAIQQRREGVLQLSDNLKTLKDINNAVFQDMESALTNFVKTGKLSFKDLAKSIIQDILAIQLKAQATKLFDSVGGVGGLFKLGMSVFNPAAGAAGAVGSFPAVGPIMMAANGGDIDGPTIVGERGPELFIPKGAGTVIPNHKMGDAMSTPSVVYNGPYIASMSAIDTQSATQFLARNKLGVWSANQSAARSLPTSR